MKRIVSVLLIAAALFAVTGCGKKVEKGEFTIEKGKFKVGMEIGYPPMEYYDADGKTPVGFDVELGKALAAKFGLEAEFIDTAWDGIFAGLETDKYDAIIAAVTITPERVQTMEFSAPYLGNGQAIVLAKNSGKNVSQPEDLKGLTVGYQAETTSDIFMTKLAEGGLKFTPAEYDKVLNAYDDLKLNRCDAVVSDDLVSAAYLTGDNCPYVKVWHGSADEYFGIAIKKGNKALLDKVNAALSEIQSDGTMKSISEKIFGADLTDSVK